MSPASLEISPRLLIFFSSRLVMVYAAQSHWRSVAAAADFGAAPVTLRPAALAVALEDATTFFLPIVLEVFPSSLGSSGAAAMESRKQGRR
jgi:hypothetical protein